MSSRIGEYAVKVDCPMFSEDKRNLEFPPAEEAKRRFLSHAMPCPLCKALPERLSWIYIVIPEWACKDAGERKGWVTICDQCKLQIDFFVEKD